jgi:hypothetical protein
MTAEAVASLRTVAFGELERRTWGVAWSMAAGQTAFLGAATGDDVISAPVTLDGTAAAEDWRLGGEGAELVCSPLGGALAASEAADAEAFDQLCRVRGSLMLRGREHRVDSLGIRGARPQVQEIDQCESVRVVWGWFEPREGFALLALRPSGSRGHETDVVSAAVLTPDDGRPVATPLLSTTYAQDGRPMRVGLELWLEDELSDDEADARQQYPRRAAGESFGTAVRAPSGDLELQAEQLRWHETDRDGAGVYLLARRR